VNTKDDGKMPDVPKKVDENVGINSVLFSADTVFKKLRKLPKKCSRTPDNIPSLYWKNVAVNVSWPLHQLFELSLRTGQVPLLWKKAHVVPIFKKGLASSRKNYRPVSLTCICCKLMESIISDAILAYLRANNLITKEQFGFLSKRSTGLTA